VELDNTTLKPIGCKFGNGSTPWIDLPYVVLGLGEVDLSTLADGMTLLYNATSGTWVPASLTTNNVAEGARLYYTDERAQDAVAALIAAGTHSGISFIYNDASNSLSATVTGTYSDEQAQDAIAALIAAGTHSGITFTYNDAANSLSATVTGGTADIRDIWLFG
jgi:hypothetical protein